MLWFFIKNASIGDSNEYTEHTINLQMIEKASLMYFHSPSDLELPMSRTKSREPNVFELFKFDST